MSQPAPDGGARGDGLGRFGGAKGGFERADFAAPPGQRLTAGTTYQAKRYPFNDGGTPALRGTWDLRAA